MANKQANDWYESFGKQQIINQLGINLSNEKDMDRLLVPDEQGKGMKPLFGKGFKGTDEEKERLFNYARDGQLFAISKKNNEAYQISNDKVQSVNQVVEDDSKRISFGRRVGYTATSWAAAPVKFGFRVFGNVLSTISGGLLEKPIELIGKGFGMLYDGITERAFSVKQQEAEKENRITLGDRFVNLLSVGTARNDKINRVKDERALVDACLNAKEALEQKAVEIKNKNIDDAILRSAYEGLSPENKELNTVKSQLKDVQTIKKEEKSSILDNTSQSTDDKPSEKTGKEMKTQLGEMYEDLREAFGVPGGFAEAAKIAQNMNQMLENLKKDPDKIKESGLSDKDLSGLSNMCTNLTTIYEKGLEAKEILLQPEKSQSISPEEKQNRVADMLVMTMFQNAMINSVLNAKISGGQIKSPRMFNSMVQDPNDFMKDMKTMVNGIDTSKALMNMNAEATAAYVAKPHELRKSISDNIREMTELARTEREQQTQQMQKQKEQQLQQQQQQPQQQPKELDQKVLKNDNAPIIN